MDQKQTLPGWLYKATGESRLVQNQEEKDAAIKEGFLPHEQAHPLAYATTEPARTVPAPVPTLPRFPDARTTHAPVPEPQRVHPPIESDTKSGKKDR